QFRTAVPEDHRGRSGLGGPGGCHTRSRGDGAGDHAPARQPELVAAPSTAMAARPHRNLRGWGERRTSPSGEVGAGADPGKGCLGPLKRRAPQGGGGSGNERVRSLSTGPDPGALPGDHRAFGAPSWNGLPFTSVDTPTLSRYGVIPPVWKGQPAPVIRHRSMSAASATTPSSSINWI